MYDESSPTGDDVDARSCWQRVTPVAWVRTGLTLIVLLTILLSVAVAVVLRPR